MVSHIVPSMSFWTFLTASHAYVLDVISLWIWLCVLHSRYKCDTKLVRKTGTNKYLTWSVKIQKVPHLEGLSSNYSKLFRVAYKASFADAESHFPTHYVRSENIRVWLSTIICHFEGISVILGDTGGTQKMQKTANELPWKKRKCKHLKRPKIVSLHFNIC